MNPYENLIRAIYAFAQDPKLTNVTEFLFPLVAVIQGAKDTPKEQLVEDIGDAFDNLIGTEEGALITGPDDPDSPIKIDIPLIDEDGTVLEFSSDLLIGIIKKVIAAKLTDNPE